MVSGTPWFKQQSVGGQGDGMPVRQKPQWHGLPELNAISARRPRAGRDEFLRGVARREVSALSDLPPMRGGTMHTAPAGARFPSQSPRWNISGPDEMPYVPINPSGAQSARDPHPPAHAVGRRGMHGDLRPSNRSEATVLAQTLAQALKKENGLTFQQELDAYATTFKEVTRQVAVHCTERGELLERLQNFYTKSAEVTARLAEKSVRRVMEEQITVLQQQLLEARQELRDARAEAGRGDATPDVMMRRFRQMQLADQKDFMEGMMAEFGYVLLSDDDGHILPPTDQAEILDEAVFSHLKGADAALVMGALSARQNPYDRRLALTSMLSQTPADERYQIVFDALDYSQRKQMFVSSFLSLVDTSKGTFIADLMNSMKQEQVHRTMISAIAALEEQSATSEASLLKAWMSSSAQPTTDAAEAENDDEDDDADGDRDPAQGAAGVDDRRVGSSRVPLIGELLAILDSDVVKQALLIGSKSWKPAETSRLVQSMLLTLSKNDLPISLTTFLDRLKPTDRRLLLGALLEHTKQKELPVLLPSVLSAGSLISSLGSANPQDLFDAIARLLKDINPNSSGKHVGLLYRSLPDKMARLGFLRDVFGNAYSFGNEEIVLLLDHFAKHSPSIIRRWMSGAAGGNAAGRRFSTAPGGPRESIVNAGGGAKRRSSGIGQGMAVPDRRESMMPGKAPSPRMSTGKSAVSFAAAAASARGKRGGSATAPENELPAVEELLRLTADALQKKVRTDATADIKLKTRTQLYKVVHDHVHQAEGLSTVHQAMKAFRHYALASDDPSQPRVHLVATMLGLLDNDAWPPQKVDFHLAFACQVLRADSEKRGILPAGDPKGGDKDAKRRMSHAPRRPSNVATDAPAAGGKRNSRASFASVAAMTGGSYIKPPKAEERRALAEYYANPSVAKDCSNLLRDAFVKPAYTVSLYSVSCACDALIADAEKRGQVADAMEGFASTTPRGESMEAMVYFDDVAKYIADAWDEDQMETEARGQGMLETVFEQADTDKDGLISLREFRDVVAAAQSEETTLDDIMEMYEQAIEMSTEQLNEETETLTKDSFVMVMEDRGILPPVQPIFIDVSALVKELISDAKAEEMRESEADAANSKGRRSLWNSIHLSHKELGKSQAMTGEMSEIEERLKATPSIPKTDEVAGVIRAAIKDNFLFRHLGEELLERVVTFFEPHVVKTGSAVITQGDKGDYFYVCESGSYDVFVDGKKVLNYSVDGDPMAEAAAAAAAMAAAPAGSVTQGQKPGGRRSSFSIQTDGTKTRRGSFVGMRESSSAHPCFGELALMYSKPRAASVVAAHDGKLWKLSRERFRLIQMLRTTTAIDITKVLRNVEILSALRFDQLQRLRDRMTESTFSPGEYVFKQGDPGEAFYLIARGSAHIVKDTSSGDKEVVVELKHPSYFGERALLHNEPRAAGARASGETPLVTISISRSEFETLLGPLQDMIDDHRREREAAVKAQQQQIEAFGLANATRDDFVAEANVSKLPLGFVSIARHVATSQVYTMREEGKKMIEANGEQDRLRRELALYSELAATNIVVPFLPTLLRAFDSPETVCLLFKQHAACHLATVAARFPGGVLTEKQLNFVGACVAKGLDVLHTEASHIYRNLNPERLHVTSDGYICLMDHRFSKRDDGSCLTLCGSPSYFAPEMVRGEIQGFHVDWWGFGVLMYELATGDSPWGATDSDDMMVLKRISAHTSGSLAVPQHVNPQLTALLNDLLEPDADARRGDESVVADAWFDNIQWPRLLDGEVPSPLQRTAETCFAESQYSEESELELSWDTVAQENNIAVSDSPLDDWSDFTFGGSNAISPSFRKNTSTLTRVVRRTSIRENGSTSVVDQLSSLKEF